MAWIESHQELAQHPKTRRLARRLGISVPTAIGHLHLLWWWAVDYALDGDLTRYEDGDVADAAMWDGDAGEFVAALASAGFLDPERTIHDWPEHAAHLIEGRRANAERQARYRARHADSTHAPVTRDSRVTNGATVPNRTVQDSTGPDSTGDVMPRAAAATAALPVDLTKLSEGARTVLQEWRQAHGKRSPPKLNPTQAAKLETAVTELGVPRLQEAAQWSAEVGAVEFIKCIRAAYTKRQRDEAPPGPEDKANGTPTGDASADDRFAAFRKYG